MRILITKEGEEIINNLNNSVHLQFSPTITIKKNSLLKRISSFSKNNFKSNNISKNTLISKIQESFYNKNDMKIIPKELSMAKKIKISKPKLIKSYIFYRYFNYLTLDTKKKVLNMRKSLNLGELNSNESLEQKIENHDSTISTTPKFVYLKDLLSNKTYDKIKNNFFNYEHEKKNSELSNPNLFRTKYKDINNDFEKVMNQTISSNKVNLINYLKWNNNVSFNFCNELSKYDEKKKYQLNKICQKFFKKNEKINVKKNNDLEKQLLNKEKEEINSIFKDFGNSIKNGLNVIQNYHKKDQTKFINNKLFNFRNKYWKRLNVDRLYIYNRSHSSNTLFDINNKTPNIKYETLRNFYKYKIYKNKNYK